MKENSGTIFMNGEVKTIKFRQTWLDYSALRILLNIYLRENMGENTN